jgi:hypothetical protein
LPFLVGTVAFAICFFTVFIAAFFGRAVPSLPFEVIDGGSPIQPNDRIVGAMLLGFSLRLTSVSRFGRSAALRQKPYASGRVRRNLNFCGLR